MNTATKTGPIPRALLRDGVFERIRDAIMDGTMQPGERLRDEALKSWLEVSRTPISAALQELSRTGLIEMKPNRYTKVAVPSERDRACAAQALTVLLGGSACLIVPNLASGRREALAARADRISHAMQNEQFNMGEIARFWRSYIHESTNECLQQLCEQNIDGLVFKAHLHDPTAPSEQAGSWRDLSERLHLGDTHEVQHAIRSIYEKGSPPARWQSAQE